MAAARDETDPDQRILAMLGARGSHVAAAAAPYESKAAANRSCLSSEGRRTRTFNQRIKSPMLYH